MHVGARAAVETRAGARLAGCHGSGCGLQVADCAGRELSAFRQRLGRPRIVVLESGQACVESPGTHGGRCTSQLMHGRPACLSILGSKGLRDVTVKLLGFLLELADQQLPHQVVDTGRAQLIDQRQIEQRVFVIAAVPVIVVNAHR